METIRFDDFIRLNRGFDLPDYKIEKGEYPVITSTNIKAFHKEYKVEGPMVVTGRSGSLGKVQYIEGRCWPLNTSLYVKDYKGNFPRYVYYFLQMMHLEQYNAGVGVPTLNQNHLHSLKIKIHEKKLQQKIASILSAYDRLIENNTRRIRLLEQMAENLYKEWFVRFRFPEHEKVEMVNGLPKGWERTVASSIIDVMSGGTPKTDHPEFYGGNIPFYTPKDANDSIFVYNTLTNITEEGLTHCNSQLYPRNTLIITARGTVGKLNLLAVPMAMNQSCFALQFKQKENPFFLYYAIRTEIAKLKKIANGGVFDTIVVKSFDHIKLIIPTRSLMDNFNLKVYSILEQVRNLSYQNQLLTRQRDLLLPRLMSGKLEVKS